MDGRTAAILAGTV